MMATIPFTHNGEEYEVRWTFDGYTFRIRAFKDGKPANGYEYSVTMPVAIEIKDHKNVDAIASLIEDAKRDVYEDQWPKYLEAVKRMEKQGS